MAVKKNNIELVKILIKAGADVDLQRFNLERIYNPISNEMRTVLADYPSHLARKQEIRELWKPVEEVEKLAEDKSLSIQNDEPVVAAKDEQEILPNPSIASLSDNNQTFFYTNLIQWLPREVLEDTLDLIVFSEFSQRKRML